MTQAACHGNHTTKLLYRLSEESSVSHLMARYRKGSPSIVQLLQLQEWRTAAPKAGKRDLMHFQVEKSSTEPSVLIR